MKRFFKISVIGFVLATMIAVSALPTMAGRLKSYNGSTGVLVLELEDKSTRKFQLTDKTKVEWMGRNTHPSALRAGAKISIQIAGALNSVPLKAAKIVDWGNSEKIVAQGAVSSPYYTAVAEYASTAGGGGTPDGAPKMDGGHHQTMATIAHGGSQNQPHGPNGQGNGLQTTHSSTNSGPAYSTTNTGGPSNYSNYGDSYTAPLEMMNIDPYSSSGQMGANDAGTLMGVDNTADTTGMQSYESAYGGASERMTGRILEASLEQGYVVLQSFEHPDLQRVLLNQANAPMQLLVPGQMIEVSGTRTPQGFKATEIKAAGGNF